MDQIDRLIMQVEGQDKLRDATRNLQAQREVVQKLVDAHKAGSLGSAQYAQQIRQEAATLKVLQGEVTTLNRSFGGAGGAARIQGVNNLAYAVQDFMSTSGGLAQKLNSTTNNLQSFATGFGVGGGWFLAITGAVTALQAFANNYETISDALSGVDREKFEKIAKQADDLKTRFEGLASKPTGQQADVANAWEKAVTEAGAKNLAKDVTESLFTSPLGAKMTPQDREAIERAGQAQLISGPDEVLPRWESEETAKARADELARQINQRIADENARKATDLIAESTGSGPQAEQARANIERLRRENPNTPTLGKFKPAADYLKDKLQGDTSALEKLLRNTPANSPDYERIESELERRAEEHFQQVRADVDAKLQAYLKDAEQKAANRAGRRAVQEEEIRQAEQAPPEEIRQSKALEYLDDFLQTRQAKDMGFGGLKLTNQEELAISEQMIKNNDAGNSERGSTIQALREFVGKQQQLRDGAFKTQLENEFANFAGSRGFSLNSDQITEAAQSIFRMMQNQVSKDAAAGRALQEVVQANMQMSGVIQSQQIMYNNIQQNAQRVNTRLSRGRAGG